MKKLLLLLVFILLSATLILNNVKTFASKSTGQTKMNPLVPLYPNVNGSGVSFGNGSMFSGNNTGSNVLASTANPITSYPKPETALNKVDANGNPVGATLGDSTSSTVDPGIAALIGQYGQAINNTQSAINRLPGQQSSGNSAIDSSFSNAINQLLLSKNQGEASYNDAKLGAGQDFVTAKNTIGSTAGSALSGLLRLLGSRGAGGGSAASIAAPQAVARGASLQRSDAATTFAGNRKSQDTNWNNFLTGYQNEVSSANNQRDTQKSTLESTIDTNRATLLQSLASLASQKDQAGGGSGTAVSQPYLDQANALLDKTANYSTSPISFNTSAFTAPSLDSYTTTPTTPEANASSTASDYFSPFIQALLGKKLATGTA